MKPTLPDWWIELYGDDLYDDPDEYLHINDDLLEQDEP